MYVFRVEMSVGDMGDEFYFNALPTRGDIILAIIDHSNIASSGFSWLYETLKDMAQKFDWISSWGNDVSAVGNNVSFGEIAKYIKVTRCRVLEGGVL